MSTWLPYILTIVGSVLAAWVTFRVRFERFESKDIQREQDWLRWRAQTDTTIDRIDTRLREHERYCDGRWNEQMKEIGKIQGRVSREEMR
jgi:hypothetical protein